MKAINISSYLSLKNKDQIFNKINNSYEITLQEHEIKTLEKMMDCFLEKEKHLLFDDFFISFKIPQIGKEFDLLKGNSSTIINIELKSEYDEESIKKQIKLNEYYLLPLKKTIFIYVFVETHNCFYILEKNSLIKVDIESINQMLIKLSKGSLNFEKEFIPSNYLISPFNTPERFINREYFLTNHQTEIANRIFLNKFNVYSIQGGAGSGKSLLIYSIAHELIKNGKRVLIVHAGYLNSGHIFLIRRRFRIISIRDFEKYLNIASDYVIFDESQRLKKEYIDKAVNNPNWKNKIFSHDPLQVLSSWEDAYLTSDYIKSLTHAEAQFMLTSKIRTNDQLSDFIICLLNKYKKKKYTNYSEYADYRFFEKTSHVMSYVYNLKKSGWVIINPTNSSYNLEVHHKYLVKEAPNVHQVIGQEFEKVAIIVPRTYLYNERGNLVFAGKSYYDAAKMFYQAITRCRNKLLIIVDNNPIILDRLIDLI